MIKKLGAKTVISEEQELVIAKALFSQRPKVQWVSEQLQSLSEVPFSIEELMLAAHPTPKGKVPEPDYVPDKLNW